MDLDVGVLQRVHARLGSADRWTQHAVARDKNGVLVDPLSPLAVRWCASGAIMAEKAHPRTIARVTRRLIYAMPPGDMRYLIEFNDQESHETVLAWVARAAALPWSTVNVKPVAL